MIRIELIKFPYIDKILVSNKRQTKYYHTSKFKEYNHLAKKNIPKRFKNDNYGVDGNGFIINNITGDKIIANPRTAGNAKYWVINFQDIYNGYIRFQVRASYILKIKKALELALTDVKPFTKFPLRLELFIYAETMPVDIDNKGVMYFKCITDMMVKQYKILPEDDSEYITDTGRTVWIKVGHRYKEQMILRVTELTKDNLNIPSEEDLEKLKLREDE